MTRNGLDGGKRIKSVDNTMDIIEYLVRNGSSSLDQLSTRLDYSKSNVHYYLQTLRDRGYVVQDGGEFKISHRFLEIGVSQLNRTALFDVGQSAIERLSEAVNNPAHLAIVEAGEVVVIRVASAEQHPESKLLVGAHLPAHATALGKAILASLPESDARAALPEELERFTQRTIIDREELFDDLADIADAGIAFENEERVEGVRAIAVPIHAGSSVVGAVGISGSIDDIQNPTQRVKARRFAMERPKILQRTARTIAEEYEAVVQEESA